MKWNPHIKPIFDAAYRLLEDETEVDGEQINAAVADTHGAHAVYEAMFELRDAGLIDPIFEGGMTLGAVRSTPLGRELAHGWPRGDAVDYSALLEVLDERIADPTATEDERSRFRRIRDGFVRAGETVGAEVIAAYIARVTGAA